MLSSSRATLFNTMAMEHMWLFKLKLIKIFKNWNYFLSHTSHIASAQELHVASHCLIRQNRSRTFPSSHKVLSDSSAPENLFSLLEDSYSSLWLRWGEAEFYSLGRLAYFWLLLLRIKPNRAPKWNPKLFTSPAPSNFWSLQLHYTVHRSGKLLASIAITSCLVSQLPVPFMKRWIP